MLKKALKRAVIGSGVLRVASKFVGNGAAIIMYHCVQDDPAAQFDVLGGMIHSTPVFTGQMEVIARHFHPATLDDVAQFLKGEKELPPRSVVVTFDDGYTDNFQMAKPILDRFGIPGVFYVAVDSIERQSVPWPGHLRHSFLMGRANSWKEPAGKVWQLDGREQRLQAFEQASTYCARLSGQPQQNFLDEVRRDLDAPPVKASPTPMMTWDELRSLANAGHTVGSHTMSHPNMAHVAEAEAQHELSESKRRLEQELGKPVVHFSYPCPALQPHWSEVTVNLTRKLGYATSVTTNGGLVRKGDDALKLRRIRPTKTIEGLRWNLERTFSGAVV